MSADIVNIGGTPLTEKGVSPSIIELLRTLTAQAQRGEIATIAVVAVSPALEIYTAVRGENHRHMLVAGTVYLQHDLSKGADG